MKQLFGHFVLNRIFTTYERQTIISTQTGVGAVLFNQFNVHRHFRPLFAGPTSLFFFDGHFIIACRQFSRTQV